MNHSFIKVLVLLASAVVVDAAIAQAVKSVDTPYLTPGQMKATSLTNTGVIDDVIGAKQVHFNVNRADENFRLTLTRWTKVAGWEFAPEHWSVPRDIPVNGAADFGTDFKSAVRGLLKASTLSDFPVQPCFYSNNVLRVIPVNELCSRSTGTNPNPNIAATAVN